MHPPFVGKNLWTSASTPIVSKKLFGPRKPSPSQVEGAWKGIIEGYTLILRWKCIYGGWNRGTPQIINFHGIVPCKPSILGSPNFRKPPWICWYSIYSHMFPYSSMISIVIHPSQPAGCSPLPPPLRPASLEPAASAQPGCENRLRSLPEKKARRRPWISSIDFLGTWINFVAILPGCGEHLGFHHWFCYYWNLK